MDSFADSLSVDEIETVRRALKATIEGRFFPDWEFETLIGVKRNVVQKVYETWPWQTVDRDEFSCAVINSMNMLIGDILIKAKTSFYSMFRKDALPSVRRCSI